MAVSLVSTGVTFPDNSTQTTAATGFGFKNRIINGAMIIDQRNAGASVTPLNAAYTIDRWFHQLSQASKISVQRSTTAPAGFINSALITSLSAYSVGVNDYFNIVQAIEGLNLTDLGWGTANAQTVTISFWVRSSLTGTFGGSVLNSGQTRAYPFTYTISAANTWEQKTVTIAGDTSGTWLTNNGIGLRLSFGLGVGSNFSSTAGAWAGGTYLSATGATSVVGTNGATFYITGVQLEKGSTATSFDYRPYGTELSLCQRYYFQTVQGSGNNPVASGFVDTTTVAVGLVNFPVSMRSAPTALSQNGTAADYDVLRAGGNVTVCSAVPTFAHATLNTAAINYIVASGLTAGQAVLLRMRNSTSYLGWSAEL
jgi:hypothetical protein